MTRPQRWHATASGEQVITLTFTVAWEAEGDCYYDPGQISGPVESSYPPEGEAECSKCVCTISDESGNVIPAESELGKLIMSSFDDGEVLQQLMDTSPSDYREDRRGHDLDR